jgi:transposase
MSTVSLSGKQRTALEHLLRTSTNARQVIRAQALLWLDDGESVEEVAERLVVSRQTIYNWSNRFKQRAHLPTDGRVADGARSGRPPTALEIIDPLLDAIIDTDPRTLGFGSTIWTVGLLQRYLLTSQRISVSTKSVSRALARLDIAWKLPRHTLAHREWYWRQAKGASSAGSGAGTTPSS